MMRIRSYHGLVCAALVLAMAGGVTAQEFRATVRGQVADTSKGALPGATVTVQNQDTNEVATATTNNEGAYTIPFLRPGNYTVTVEMSGFQKHTRTERRACRSARPPRSTCSWASGSPRRSTSRRRRRCSKPAGPTAARSSTAPASPSCRCSRAARWRSPCSSPASTTTPRRSTCRPFDNGALASWSMNGGSNSNNEFLLDGAPNNANQGGNNIAYVPPAEAVQEMKISTNSYDAQYGRTAGGVVNMSLKSGTNSFHGVVYDFMRRKALAANSFLLNSRQSPKTDQYIDQYGFSVDGPIWKNKTFFLFTGEKYREGTPAPLFSTVPTPAMKNGDFSNLVDALRAT